MEVFQKKNKVEFKLFIMFSWLAHPPTKTIHPDA